MDEIRGTGKVENETYAYTVSEQLGTRNDEVRHLHSSYIIVARGGYSALPCPLLP